MVVETSQCAQRGHDHRQPLASPKPLPLEIPIDNHQGIETDRAVVDEHPSVHFANIDAALAPARDQSRRFIEAGRDAEVSRKMVECSERKDAELRLRSN